MEIEIIFLPTYQTYQVKMDHTAEKISAELIKIANEYGIADKICCIITDNATNMMATARLTCTVETYSLFCSHTQFNSARGNRE